MTPASVKIADGSPGTTVSFKSTETSVQRQKIRNCVRSLSLSVLEKSCCNCSSFKCPELLHQSQVYAVFYCCESVHCVLLLDESRLPNWTNCTFAHPVNLVWDPGEKRPESRRVLYWIWLIAHTCPVCSVGDSIERQRARLGTYGCSKTISQIICYGSFSL